jgi:hypothetical protein
MDLFNVLFRNEQTLFRNIRRFTATFALSTVTAYGFRTYVSIREKNDRFEFKRARTPSRLFFC